MSSWYAWIPVLTPCLVPVEEDEIGDKVLSSERGDKDRLMSLDLDDSSQVVADNLPLYFDPNFLDTARAQMNCSADSVCFYYVRHFVDGESGGGAGRIRSIDLQQGEGKRVVFAYADGRITHTGIFPLTSADADSTAEIVAISGTGLMKYSVCLGKAWTRHPCKDKVLSTHARHHYETVRDIYHHHIHTHGDFTLFPRQAKEDAEAVSMISRQFMKHVVHSQKFIKEEIRAATDAAAKGRAADSDTLSSSISSAMGCLAYCEHFHAMHAKTLPYVWEAATSPFAAARDSLSALKYAAETNRGDVPTVFDRVMLYVAIASFAAAVYAPVKDLLACAPCFSKCYPGWHTSSAIAITSILAVVWTAWIQWCVEPSFPILGSKRTRS